MNDKVRPVNLRICRSCVASSTPNGWTQLDDAAAKEGFVYCSAEKRMVNHSYADTCKFNVEYIMSDGVKDVST